MSESAKQPVKQIVDQSGNQTGEQPGNGKDLPELANELDQNETVVGGIKRDNYSAHGFNFEDPHDVRKRIWNHERQCSGC